MTVLDFAIGVRKRASFKTREEEDVIHELLWSFFLFLLLPVEPRGLVGAVGAVGQGSVLLPWLLKPDVAVEEGEKPPPIRAEKRHYPHVKGW